MIGTAYGTMTSIQNAGLAVFSTIIGAITSKPGVKNTIWESTIPLMFFIGCAGISVGITCLMYIIDKATTGGILNADGKTKKAYQKNVLNAKPVGSTTINYDS